VAVGLCASLTERDYVFGNHRSHGHYLAKGGGLKELVAENYCAKEVQPGTRWLHASDRRR
jgi:pyruvate dehydrogenase E1 component alpha subunit